MNVQRILSLLEEHVEKGVLGLAALFLVAMVWMYLIRTPNRVEFAGRALGPRELAQAVYEEAKSLESRLRTARGKEPEVERFADELRALHERGIFASAEPQAPPLPQELPPTAPLGKPVTIAGLEAIGTKRGSVELVTPQAPRSPVIESGRSQVLREPLDLDKLVEEVAAGRTTALTPVTDETTRKKVETSWVTVAAYYDPEADMERMKKAGYASYRTRVYLVGTELQRQELGPGGVWSDWATVQATDAMPKLKLPEPKFDRRTGRLTNRAEIARVLQVVQQQQTVLVEPPFYVVQAGDEWDIPDLPNLEEPQVVRAATTYGGAYPPGVFGAPGGRPGQAAGGTAAAGQSKTQKQNKPSKPPRVRQPVRPGGGAGVGGAYPPGVFGRPPVGAGGGQPSKQDQRQEQLRQYRKLLADARKAAADKDWNTVRQLATQMTQLDLIPKKLKEQAERILAKANKELGTAARGVAGAVGATYGKPKSRVEMILPRPLKNRDTGELAVWFHDDTVQPGKVYRYRMRVRVWNRYLGVPQPLKNPEDARKVVVAGAWSAPTEPVEVRAEHYFFVQGRKVGEPVARVEVWRFHKGSWLKETFDVAVGDVIGGVKTVETDELDEQLRPKRERIDFSTGAVVLDIRFDEAVPVRLTRRDGSFTYTPRQSVTIVYLDPTDGSVHQRTQALDRADPLRKWLEDQINEQG